MDKQLLDALNNIGDALELLVDALKNKEEAKSATGAALQSGDFGKQLETISAEIKSIKADTQQIIKNQQTIISLSKQKEKDKKTDEFEGASDPKKENAIKKGVTTILLIAVAVLAIGLAFKLVGKVDILSVIALGIGITLVAFAFEKVASMKLGIKEAAIVGAVMIIASTALMISSYILAMIKPVGLREMITALFIAGTFTILAPNFHKFILAFKGMGMMTLLKTVIFLPMILVSMSTAIWLSSEILQNVKPIGLMQALSSIFIAGIFAVISYGIRNMISAFKGINIVDILLAATFLPTILVSVSKAIVDASDVLKDVKMIGLGAFFGSIMVSAIFVVLSFAIKKMISAFKDINPAVAAIAAISLPIILVALSYAIMLSSEALTNVVPIGMPQFLTSLAISVVFIVLSIAAAIMVKALGKMNPGKAAIIAGISVILFVAMSYAIMLSSEYLAQVTPVDYSLLFNIIVMSITLAISVIAIAVTIFVLDKLGMLKKPLNFIIGSLFIILTAAVVAVSSQILALGKYDKYPDIDWRLGVTLTIGIFAILAGVIGTVILLSAGLGAAAFALGLGMMIVIAATIVEISNILQGGNYSYGSDLEKWATPVTEMYLIFAPMMMALGAMGLVGAVISFFGGPDPFEMAKVSMIQIAETIVEVSHVLSGGNWKKGPTKEWAEGVSIAIAAFAPVYSELSRMSIFDVLFGGGDKSEDFANTIRSVSRGLIDAGKYFNEYGMAGDSWTNAPTEEWAKGVGTAVAAFATAIMNMDEAGVDTDADDLYDDDGMISVMLGVAKGIIAVGRYFNEYGLTNWDENMVPSEEWAAGLSKMLTSFSGALVNMDKFMDADDPDEINDVLVGLARALTNVGKRFQDYGPSEWSLKDVPDEEYAAGLSALVSTVSEMGRNLSDLMVGSIASKFLLKGANSIVNTAEILFNGKEYFEFRMDSEFIHNIGKSLLVYAMYAKMLDTILTDKTVIDTPFGDIEFEKKKDIGIMNKISYSLINVAKLFWKNKKYFEFNIDPNYVKNLSSNILDFTNLVNELNKNDKSGFSLTSFFEDDPITKISNQLIKLAEGYDKLATSLTKLGNATKLLGVDAKSLANLTNDISSGRAARNVFWWNSRDGQSINMPNKQEMPFMKTNVSALSPKTIGDKGTGDINKKVIIEKMDQVIELLTNISEKSNSINDYLENIDTNIDEL